jgi:hypothetical protein
VTRVLIAEGCREVDGPSGRRYYARNYQQGGSFDMTDPRDVRQAVKIGGTIASEAGTTRRGIGYRCTGCGFGSFTRACGRCGGVCERE